MDMVDWAYHGRNCTGHCVSYCPAISPRESPKGTESTDFIQCIVNVRPEVLYVSSMCVLALLRRRGGTHRRSEYYGGTKSKPLPEYEYSSTTRVRLHQMNMSVGSCPLIPDSRISTRSFSQFTRRLDKVLVTTASPESYYQLLKTR